MHIDLWVTLAALIVGVVVGLTGMGGGALMTPVLVLVFGIQPLAAVSSDLVASVIMKPVGSLVHLRKRTVHTELLLWLMLGSVPAAFAGVFVIKLFGHGAALQQNVKIALGGALLLASAAAALNAWLRARRPVPPMHGPLSRRPLATFLIGALGGLLVGMTSVGSGSVVVVLLMFLYPTLSGAELVGTDLVQAVPMVGAAAAGHVLFGDFRLGLTLSLLLGAIPGVYVGAHLSARSSDRVIRPALVLVLLATGLKLLNLGNIQVALILGTVVVVGGLGLLAAGVLGGGAVAIRPMEDSAA